MRESGMTRRFITAKTADAEGQAPAHRSPAKAGEALAGEHEHRRRGEGDEEVHPEPEENAEAAPPVYAAFPGGHWRRTGR
jgi:hypothetical protein